MKIQLLMSVLLVVLVGCAQEGSQSMNGKESVKAGTVNKTVQLIGSNETIPFMATPVATTVSRKEGGPLTAITTLSNFQLQDSDSWVSYTTLIDELKAKAKAVVTPSGVAADSSRSGRRIHSLDPLSPYRDIETGIPLGPDYFHTGFLYDREDENSCWMPQGLTGSADAGELSANSAGKKLLAVSWHDENCGTPENKNDRDEVGVRISLVDVTDMDHIKYRHVLLVEPVRDAGAATFNAVNIHAGGIVWAGDYLYVADTAHGLRVFDMTSIMQVDVDNDKIGVDKAGKMYAYGYEFILPQAGNYKAINGTSLDTQTTMLFSWVSLDRSSDPPVLLTGEYNDINFGKNPRPSNNGRAFLWPLNKTTNKLDVDPATKSVKASSAYYMNQHRLQGGFTHMVNGKRKFWFAGSHKAGYYKLYRKSEAKGLEKTFAWPGGTPQNMTYSSVSDNLWSLAESSSWPNQRPVWAVKLSDID